MEFVCEMSGCHGGSLENAIRWIKVAKAVGADAVKFQIFDPDRLAFKRAQDGLAPSDQLRNLYRQTFTPLFWFADLVSACEELHIPWFASVFSKEDVDFAVSIRCPRLKIASFEAKDCDLISYVVSKNRPIIVSINQDAPWELMANAILTADTHAIFDECRDLTVLHATNYGINSRDAKFAKVMQMKTQLRKDIKFGLSDHTIARNSSLLAMLAASAGAHMIERHMKLTDVRSPDDDFSSYPDEMENIIMNVKASAQIMEKTNGSEN